MLWIDVRRHAEMTALCVSVLAALAGCGGGDGATAIPAPVPAPVPLAAMHDSFGRAVPEVEFGQGDPRAAGIDGTAAEDGPLAGAPVRAVDVQGRIATATTDVQGYYRLRVDTLQPPFVVEVIRPDGSSWHAPVRGPLTERGFVTVNLTPLTDKLASDLARAAGKAGASQLTPADVASQGALLSTAAAVLTTQLGELLSALGVPAATFDPLQQPFRADGTGHSAVLGRIAAERLPDGATSIVLRQQVNGRLFFGELTAGAGNAPVDITGLVLTDGQELLPASAMQTEFTGGYSYRFAAWRAPGSSYTLAIVQQPSHASCQVGRATATAGAPDNQKPQIWCSKVTSAPRVTVLGLAGPGLQLRLGNEVLDVPAGATEAVFAQQAPVDSLLDISVQRSPAGQECRGGPDVRELAPAFNLFMYSYGSVSGLVQCASGFHALAGRVEGPARSELELRLRWYAGDLGTLLKLPAGAAGFTFPGWRAAGTPYEVSVHRQPLDEDCQLVNGSGELAADVASRVLLRCSAVLVAAGRRLEGVVRFNPAGAVFYDYVELEAAGQTVQAWVRDGQDSVTRFQFPQRLPPGAPYTVKVLRAPVYFHGPYLRGTMACEVTVGATGVAGAAQQQQPEVRCGF